MREHSGGYINQAAYWDIGTEAARGRDGDTRREAAKKYNDHKHPAALIQTADDLVAWANEPQLSSGMGYLQDNAAQLARNAGDMALFGGRLYASDGLGGVFPVSGLGGAVSVTQQGNAVVQPDVLSYTTALAAPVRYGVGSVGEGVSIACGSAQFLDTDMRVSTATRHVVFSCAAAVHISGDPADWASLPVAPYGVLTISTSVFVDGYAPDTSTDISTSPVGGLIGNVSQHVLDAAGLATPGYGKVQDELPLTDECIVSISVGLPTLQQMYAAGGLGADDITPEAETLWATLRARCSVELISPQLAVRYIFEA